MRYESKYCAFIRFKIRYESKYRNFFESSFRLEIGLYASQSNSKSFDSVLVPN